MSLSPVSYKKMIVLWIAKGGISLVFRVGASFPLLALCSLVLPVPSAPTQCTSPWGQPCADWGLHQVAEWQDAGLCNCQRALGNITSLFQSWNRFSKSLPKRLTAVNPIGNQTFFCQSDQCTLKICPVASAHVQKDMYCLRFFLQPTFAVMKLLFLQSSCHPNSPR